MDFFGYRTMVRQEEGDNPALLIKARFSQVDVGLGESFWSKTPDVFFSSQPFEQPVPSGRVSSSFLLKTTGAWHGHNVVVDDNFSLLLGGDPQVPISPLFARDLAGRIIYLGYGPIKKRPEEFVAYPSDTKSVFPRYCVDVDKMHGKALLEEVFLTKFRCLDTALFPRSKVSGAAQRSLGVFEQPNMYPYKIRLDTFYLDGWKLPQTEMLFARSEGIDSVVARSLGENILADWKGRLSTENYDAFIERLGGEVWVEDLFAKGCTLIPTFEACNGHHVVGREFELLDFWPGKAVEGLHTVAEVKPHHAPLGTILDVLEPGFVTQDFVSPAVVVISDGSLYVTPNMDDPLPLVPNLNLPHPRTIDDWEVVWVPTHPLHFEAPALWGWDEVTGYFMQLSGPIWDPLHYYYASVDEVLKAYKTPFPYEKNRWLAPVPDHMRGRFYPVVSMSGFDSTDIKTKEKREAEKLLPISALRRVEDGLLGANIGYHPLPLEFEYELDPFWAPDLHPLNRNHGVCPPAFSIRMCPVISPQVSAGRYLDSVVAPENTPWLKTEALMGTPTDDPLENYPQLARYVVPDLDILGVIAMAQMPFLADPGRALLTETVAELWDGFDSYEDIEKLQPGLFDALMDWRQECLNYLRMRHLVFRETPLLYMLAWWYGLNVPELFDLYKDALKGEFGSKNERSERGNQISAVLGQVNTPSEAPKPTSSPVFDDGVDTIGPDGKPLAAIGSGLDGLEEQE